MMSRTIALLTLVAFALPLPASAADHMTFKNNLLPGHLSIHRVSRMTRRKARRKDFVEKLSYAQTAEWVQCNLSDSQSAGVQLYQMMVDQPARVISLFHDAKRIRPAPGAERFNLSKGSTRLHSIATSFRDAPYQVPLCDPAEQAVLRAMLDFAHWPKKKVNAGHRWVRAFEGGGFSGTQTFEFVDLVRIKGEVAARVTLFIEGSFHGALEKDYHFEKAQVIIHWARLDRTLLKLEGQAHYERRRPNGDDEYKLKVDVGLKRLVALQPEEQDLTIDQLTLFAMADQKRREGLYRDAIRLCNVFQDEWPDSIWWPAVKEVARRSRPRQSSGKRLTTSELKKALAKSLITWEAARSNDEYDILDHTRTLLRQVAKDYRNKLLKLAKDREKSIRARAVFALAFSDRPDDFRLVQKATRDRSSLVRGMALAGLAARRDPRTNVEMLILHLDDKKSSVRAHACRAIAACVPREHFSIARVADKLGHLMVFDKKSRVRLEAIRALAAIGAPADIPRLDGALTHEVNKTNRAAIEKAIAALNSLDG